MESRLESLRSMAGAAVIASLTDPPDWTECVFLSQFGIDVTKHPLLYEPLLRRAVHSLGLGTTSHLTMEQDLRSLLWDDELDAVDCVASIAARFQGAAVLLRLRTGTSIQTTTLVFEDGHHTVAVVNAGANGRATSVRTNQGMLWRAHSQVVEQSSTTRPQCKFQFGDLGGVVEGIRILNY